MAVGRAPEVAYRPIRCQRAGLSWEHEAGDRGFGRKKTKKRPMLAADPKTGDLFIINSGSTMRWNKKRGLMG